MVENRTKVAFVIVCWNNEKLLQDCLESIMAQTYSNHITFLVDNGSKDDSIKVARQTMQDINIIETGKNNGFARGNNIGINEAIKEPSIGYVALLNTDARLDKEWLNTITDFSKRKPKAALLQGTTLNYFDKKIIDSTHLYMTKGGQAAQGSWLESYFEELGPKKVFGVNAAACLITRAFVEAQPYKNFFDESFFMYLEDVDISARATIMGWDNYLVPGAKAFHIGSASSGGDTGYSNYGLYMTFRNNLGVIIKNYPWKLVFKLFLNLPINDYRTVRHLYRAGNKTAGKKVIIGRLVGIYRSPIYLLKRYKLLGRRKIDSDYLWQLMNIGY